MPTIEISDALYQKLQLKMALTQRSFDEVIDDRIGRQDDSQFPLLYDVLQSLPVGCTIVDAQQDDLPIIYANDAFVDITGYTQDEIIGRNCRFLQKDDRDQPGLTVIREAIKQQIACNTRIRNYRKDGTLFWNQLHIAPIQSASGTITHFIGIQQDVTEVVRLADDLTMRKARYRIITELMSDYAFSIGVQPDGTLINEWVSGAFEQITGFTLGNMGDVVSFKQTHPDDLERVKSELAHMLNNNKVTSEYRIKTAWDTYIWLSILRTPVWDEQEGRVVRFYGAARDITAQKETEASLKESEERFKLMANHAPVMIWMADGNYQCTYVNQVWLDFRGRTLEQELGTGWAEGIHPEDRERHIKLYREIFTNFQPFQIEFRLLRHDGVYCWVQNEGVPRFMDDGTFLGFIGSCVDVTEIKAMQEELEKRVNQKTAELREEVQRRQQAEVELKHERDLLQNMMLTSPSGIILVDLEGRVRFASQHVNTILKVEREILLDESFLNEHWKIYTLYGDLITRDDHPRRQVIKKKSPLYDQEMILEKENGEKLILSMNLAPILNDDNEVSEIVISLNNITLQKEWETGLKSALEKERQLNMLKSQFISTITHEFKTPLTIIGTSSYLLRAKADTISREDQHKRIDRIEEQVKRLNKMVDNIVELNRTGSFDYLLQLEEINLEECINGIVEDIRVAYEDRVKIIATFALSQTDCLLDGTLLNQIISNLLSNAVKYSDLGGTVFINSTCESESLRISVSDNGIGIPKDDQQYLFNDFFRATNVENRPGIGFGLTVVRQAVKVLGGELDFESQEGVGTTFTVTLPMRHN
ncbi:MAG: PAS domain S-box protein [Aggregatilineales bacterium]